MRHRSTQVALCIGLLVASLLLAPRAFAQSGALYFPSTGHHLTDEYGFLSFWQAHQGERVFGFPITEAQAIDNVTVQYFERGRLELVSDQASGTTSVQVGRVGVEYAEAMYKTFAAPPPRKLKTGARLFESTGHTLRSPFLAFWEANGGEAIFGAPISEALWELTDSGQRQVQYFERARLERDAAQARTDAEIVVSDLGRALALIRGINTAAVGNWGAESYGPATPRGPNVVSLDIPTPAPTQPPQAVAAQPAQPKPAQAKPAPKPATSKPRGAPPVSTDGKLILINLSDQWVYAYEDGKQVFDAPVSTGRDGMETPTGSYKIYDKLKVQTMDGVTDGVPWEVPNVPNVMYFNGGVALHGTYWHNRFGTGARVSHGCVNLPLKSAAWFYEWAPVGTLVKVTY